MSHLDISTNPQTLSDNIDWNDPEVNKSLDSMAQIIIDYVKYRTSQGYIYKPLPGRRGKWIKRRGF